MKMYRMYKCPSCGKDDVKVKILANGRNITRHPKPCCNCGKTHEADELKTPIVEFIVSLSGKEIIVKRWN